MGALLLWIIAVTTVWFPQFPFSFSTTLTSISEGKMLYSLHEIRWMLNDASDLNELVINKVIDTLQCINEYNIDHNHILTVIDYSLPSNQKRLWVFDLDEKKLLFHTYVSHGIKSGALLSHYFSNKYNSRASSIGIYQTQGAYYGRDGLSLRLDGLDRNFNDNAANRSVVIHSGWYVEEPFIKKYGRPGRSWGCPALPLENSEAIINTIKDKSLLIIYYPSDSWFTKSRYLNCNAVALSQHTLQPSKILPDVTPRQEKRDEILFLGSSSSGKHEESRPVAVIQADTWQSIFHRTPPLTRMLRRQINHEEYIALNSSELNSLIITPRIEMIHFVIPVIKEVRSGYYETQMQFVDLGKIREVKINNIFTRENSLSASYTVYFEGRPGINLNTSNQFIRWVGL